MSPVAVAGPTWSRTLLGDAGAADILDVAELADGTFVALGRSQLPDAGAAGTWRIRLDVEGEPLGLVGWRTPARHVTDTAAVAPDGGAFIAGRHLVEIATIHDAWLSRVAQDGSIAWSIRLRRNDGKHHVERLLPVPDGGCIGVGWMQDSDASPSWAWAFRVDAAGSVEWQGVYKTPDDGPDRRNEQKIHGARLTSDGGLIVAGSAATWAGGRNDLWVARLDVAGDLEWQATLGGRLAEEGRDVAELPDGGYLAVGWTRSFTESEHAGWALRFDEAGELLWQRVFGDDDYGALESVLATREGEAVVLGRLETAPAAGNELWLAALDTADGGVLWQRRAPEQPGAHGAVLRRAADGDLVAGANHSHGMANAQAWLLRLDSGGLQSSCTLLRDASSGWSSPPVSTRALDAARGGSLPEVRSITPLVPTAVAGTSTPLCGPPGCAPPTCEGIGQIFAPTCWPDQTLLVVDVLDGEPPLTVQWDVDGDGAVDATGNPVAVDLPPGEWMVTAAVTDACTDPVPASCVVAGSVRVVVPITPSEVSDVAAGARPLRVSKGSAPDLLDVSVESSGGDLAYNIRKGLLPEFFLFEADGASGCANWTWHDHGDGTIGWTVRVRFDSWILITASSECEEGPVGTNSFGAERSARPDWIPCGAATR